MLPETYKFPRGTTRDQVIQRMQQTQKRVLAEIWERRNPDIPVKTPEQLITLASIVEKETGKADERSRVAAVFVNRLRQKIKLQSDPTIIYGLVGGKGTLGRPIKRSEIQQPSPYNTYVIDGLPPGPIANPGRASLEAAANPARTRDLFFVADGTGGHAFTETYDQHQKNVAKLRASEKQIQNDTVEPADDPAPPPAAATAPADASPTATTPAKPPPKSPRVRRGRVRRNRPRRRRWFSSSAAAGRKPNSTLLENVLRSHLRSANLKPVPSGEIHTMPLSSMTGFARSHGASGPYAFEWELKSVNAKGFDLRMRLPPGWDELEALAKKRAGELLSRGTVYANLNVKRANAVSTIRINEEVLASIVKVAGVLAGKIDAVAPSIDGLLAIKGVIEVVEPESNEAEDKAAKAAAAAAFEQALADLVKMRQREGVTLGQILSHRMDEIEKLAKKAEAAPGRKPEAIKARLAEQVAALLEFLRAFRFRPAQSGSDHDRGKGRHPRRARSHRLAHLAGPRDDRQGRTGRAAARFPGAGIQPRGQHLLLQVERPRIDQYRPRNEERGRAIPRAGSESGVMHDGWRPRLRRG